MRVLTCVKRIRIAGPLQLCEHLQQAQPPESLDMEQAFILWRRVDTHGHDACRLTQTESGWRLQGGAVFVEDGETGSVQYDVRHSRDWLTETASISGWVGPREIQIQIERRADGGWVMNGDPVPKVMGAMDIDLGLTPATNTTAIRRLKLEQGQKAQSLAAWLDPTDWQLKPLEQTYFRSPTVAAAPAAAAAADTYEYASPAHGFSAILSVNDSGLVTSYPGIWLAE